LYTKPTPFLTTRLPGNHMEIRKLSVSDDAIFFLCNIAFEQYLRVNSHWASTTRHPLRHE